MSQQNSDLVEAVRKILQEERERERLSETIKGLQDRIDKLYEQLSKQSKKSVSAEEIKQIEASISELKSAILELAKQSTKVSEIDELKQALSNLTKELADLKKASQELEEVKKKVEHKHVWEDRGGVLVCKDCGEMIPIPKNYVKLENTDDLFSYLFKKHKHGNEEYNNIFDCPYCREDLINYLKKHNFNVWASGDELRLKIPRKK